MRSVAGKIGLALVGAVAAAVLAARGAKLITTSDRTALAALVVVALVAVLTPAWAANSDSRRRRAAREEVDAEQALSAALWTIIDLLEASGLDVDYRDFSLSVYRLRTSRSRETELLLVHRERARNRAASSGITWRPGLGVIGTCVQTRDVAAQDFAALSTAPDLASPQDWAALPDEVRLGLSWEQFSQARGKYGTIVAAPSTTTRQGRTVVLGCAALDGPPDMVDALTEAPVINQMLLAADGLLQT